MKARHSALRHQTGLSLVELMVGVAIGLMVVAAAATVTATQLGDSRRLVLEAQVQQDLRATADIIARELRRAGHWDNAATSVWAPGSAVAANPYATVTIAAGSDEVAVTRSAGAVEFRLLAGPPGVVQMQRGAGGWQALTDPATLDVTGLNIQAQPIAAIQMGCTALCTGGGQACWPTIEVRELQVQINGRAVSDAAVLRSIRSSVRLRNDRIVNNNVANPPGLLCPQ